MKTFTFYQDIKVQACNSEPTMEQDLAKYNNPWENIPNGVYAVSEDGLPVDIESADNTCIGVALIVNDAPTPQRLMIEKNGEANTASIKAAYTADGATNTDYIYFYLGMCGSDGVGITNWTAGDGATIPTDYTTWSKNSTYAWNDFNGKENTAALQAATDTDAYTTYANMTTYCTKFNETPTENQGYTDWYIPACGQMALIYLNMTEINKALTKIGGTTLASAGYWSSSEYSGDDGWRVNFGNGCVDLNYKNYFSRVRFVRNLVNE